ncbi:hypothetical protein [Lacinutrix undariae]
MTKQPLIIIIIIGILISLNSCKQTESKKMVESEVKEVVETKTETSKSNSVTELYIENDSLVIELMSELERIALNEKFAVEKKPIKNKHVENLVDTIITRTFENTKLTSYKALNKEWIYKAKIENPEFELNDFVKVGTKKYVVEKSLAEGIQNDTLKIGNLEQTSVFNLIFENGILKMITYEGYID